MYQNGKIYKIVSDLTDMIYIGSTVQPLYKRHHEHISKYNDFLNNKYHYVSSYDLVKLGATKIELIEDYPCERKEQLNAREGYYIKLYKDTCVNRIISGRTMKEWENDNKDYLIEKHKEYYDNNKTTINEKHKEWLNNNKEQQKQYYKERNKILYNCECGSIIRISNKSQHIKSLKHQEFISKQN